MVYFNLNKEAFTPEKIKEYNKYAIEEMGEESKDSLRIDSDKESIKSLEVKDGELSIGIDTEIGYISIDVPLNMDIAINIFEYFLSKVRKAKEVLEGVKELKEM